MSKHSTTHRTLSRRLAALLAALALLAAMALPVYAEALDGTTGTAQAESNGTTGTAQAEIGDTISDGTVTTENDSTTPEGKEAAEDSTANADGNNASENKDTKDNASSSTTGDSTTPAGDAVPSTGTTQPSSTDNTAPTVAGENKNNTNDTTSKDSSDNSESPEDVQLQDDGEAGDISLATESGKETFTIYFAAPSSWGNGDYQVYFNAQKVQYGEGDANYVNRLMEKIETLNYPDRNVYKVDLTNSTDCPYDHYNKLEFCKKETNKNDVWIQAFVDKWTEKSEFANSLYDYDGSNWKLVPNYQTFDRNNHKSFAGKTMFFQNQSNATLAKVQAVFYEKIDGSLQTVKTIDLEAIEAGKHASFTIPDENCSYIRFLVSGEETPRYSFYGQQDGGETDKFFTYDSAKAFCYVYQTNDSGSWTTLQGENRVYFDATFSKMKTNSPNDAGGNYSIPAADSTSVYYRAKGEGVNSVSGLMTQDSPNSNLYYVELNAAYTEIAFSQGDLTNDTISANNGQSTAWEIIPQTYENPCFYADTYDDSVYGKGPRSGYWDKKGEIRDAEKGKGKTNDPVVNVPPATFTPESNTKYINTTLYDYYTDWELNGNNRDKYKGDNGASQRNWVTFRQFDQALSDYYQKDRTQTVLYPMYTGQFQPAAYDKNDGKLWGFGFAEVADSLNLYGYNETNKFMAVNNSTIDVDGNGLKATDDKYYDDAFQGLTGDNLVDGEPVMYNTKLTVPYFNKDFLLKSNSKNAKLGEVYDNVSFPFTKRQGVFHNGNESSVEYWYFDSNDTTLYLKQDTGNTGYFLQKQEKDKRTGSRNLKSNSDYHENGTFGFFPFNENSTDHQASTYNYGFGAKLKFQFTMNEDGQVYGTDGETKVPIKFFFSGDDDVWVYIDDELALDVGGDHGKVSGLLEFGLKDGNLVYTPYVSDVKASNAARMYQYDSSGKSVEYLKTGNNIPFHYKGTEKPITPGTHTLTMYYMERGMWESNMAVAFNFPDNNELQVQKIVEDRNVNKLFKGCFDDQRLFNFTIRNQATHYGKTEAAGDAVTTINLLQPGKSTPVQNFTTTATHAEPDTGGKNRFTIVNNPPDNPNVTDDTPLLNWYTQFEDLTPSPGSNKEKRYGILALGDGQTIDITGMSYLSFDVYVDSDEGDAALSNMYLELRDSKGKQKGCLGQTFIGGKDLYGQVEMHNKHWITVKLSLGDVKAEKDFDEKHVKELRFGCNYPRSIYLRNIVFSSKAVPQTVTGFTTKQEDIADYGSAQEGKLMPAVNAQYTSDAEKGTMVVDKNGGFVLQNKETVTFKDQFRRGSYLSINEQVDKNLFDTQWTIYEDGKAVTSTKEGDGKKLTLDGDSISLKDKTGTAPDDGRIELKNAEGDAAQIAPNYNAYDGIKPSKKDENDNTIVFRSYANPDATDADGETQLKVVFVNTVKTGSLTIKKEQDGKGENLDGNTYTFRVRFTNVGGHALEDEAIVEPYKVTVGKPCVINNIPVGTRFTIEEVTPEDGSKLTKVSVTGGGSGTMVLNNQTVRGSIVAGDENKAVATFTNTKQETLDITGEKVWKNADNSLMTEHPATIYVQLQRRCVGETSELSWTPVTYLNETYTRVEQKYEGMKFSFLGLPAKDYDGGNQTPYEYRVVEGSVDNKGVFQAVDDEKTITIGEKVYSVTYKYTASKPDDSSNNNAKQTVTITNTQQDPKFTLDVTKKSAENDGENDKQKLLEGVEFTLEKLDENGQVDTSFETKTGITDGQGVLKLKNSGGSTSDKAFADLEAGTYRLTETKTAEGYNLLSAPIVITFTKDGQCRIGNDALMQAKNDTIFTGDAVNGYKLALTVLNRKTPALPHTGADAPSLWLLIGLPLAVAGLLILVFRYNKKGGRTR